MRDRKLDAKAFDGVVVIESGYELFYLHTDKAKALVSKINNAIQKIEGREINPCPHCGSDGKMIAQLTTSKNIYYVCCSNCLLTGPQGITTIGARWNWNQLQCVRKDRPTTFEKEFVLDEFPMPNDKGKE